MPDRGHYLTLVEGRGGPPLFAPLIDRLFAASWAGRRWITEATLEDEIAAARACGLCHCHVQGSTPDLYLPPLLREDEVVMRCQEEDGQTRRWHQEVRTRAGTLRRELVEQPGKGLTPVDTFVRNLDDLEVVDHLCQDLLAGRRDDAVRGRYQALVGRLRPAGAVVQIQVELPWFLFGLPGFADLPILLHSEDPARYAASMVLAEQAITRLTRLLLEAGVDVIWLGAPGTELMSPALWEEIVIPQSRRLCQVIRDAGGLSHFHCCGCSQAWIDRGYYGRIGMDLVETLAPPPSGTVTDLAAARRAIPPTIVTRGNLDLGLLRDGTPAACAAAARAALAATAGWPHILGAADAILDGTPAANLQAVVQAVAAVGTGA